MNLKEFIGVDAHYRKPNGEVMEHREFYGAVVDAIGYEKCKRYLPATDEVIVEAYAQDQYLNNIPLSAWDGKGMYIRKHLALLGVKTYAPAQLVCILKETAKRLVEENG